MSDKFKANLWIALPAALITLGVYALMGMNVAPIEITESANLLLILPYLLIIVLAITGLNVTVVLVSGILASVAVAVISGYGMLELAGFMGAGIDSMGNLIIITMLAAGVLGIIKAAGGVNYILQCLTARISGVRGAQACIAFLVAIVNVCTANNTVAIIAVGSLSKSIAERYGIDARKAASLLDTCSCIAQCLIPYGAQTLLATSLAGISPAEPWGYLYYPWALIVMVTLSIIFRFPRRLS
jgi:Na+/H+ antiporter NhaC